ncbi:MAG: hypothetical protein AAGH15_22675 [Myxococcota bacterium]
MSRRAIARALGIALLVVAPGPAEGQREGAPGRDLAQTSDFWREVRRPGFRRAYELVAQAERLEMRRAREQPTHPDYVRAVLRERAIVRLERARELAPEEPFILFFLGSLLALHEMPGVPGTEPLRRIDDAIEVLEELRTRAPDFAPGRAELQLALLYGRRGDRERSIALYAECVDRCFDRRTRAQAAGNMAEELMLSGRLVEALGRYRQAAAFSRRRSGDLLALQLAHWGMALCRDRLGEHADALDEAETALGLGNGMEVLVSEGVFFEPASELRAYQGLGHLAAARASRGRERRGHLRRAVQSWRAYLRLAPAGDPWRGLAERHLAEARDALTAAEAERVREGP